MRQASVDSKFSVVSGGSSVISLNEMDTVEVLEKPAQETRPEGEHQTGDGQDEEVVEEEEGEFEKGEDLGQEEGDGVSPGDSQAQAHGSCKEASPVEQMQQPQEEQQQQLCEHVEAGHVGSVAQQVSADVCETGTEQGTGQGLFECNILGLQSLNKSGLVRYQAGTLQTCKSLCRKLLSMMTHSYDLHRK